MVSFFISCLYFTTAARHAAGACAAGADAVTPAAAGNIAKSVAVNQPVTRNLS